jgi:hypothetical protein
MSSFPAFFSAQRSRPRAGARFARRGLALALVAALALTCGAARAFDLSDLMRNLGRVKERRGQFTETKYLALFNEPLKSKGEVRYVAPNFFEKTTQEPVADVMRVDGESLYLERGRQKYNVKLSRQPRAAAFIDAIAGLLTGDASFLERSYRYELSGSAADWSLKLVPRGVAMLDYVTEIRASGDETQVKRIEYLQVDGDRSVMEIEPLLTR